MLKMFRSLIPASVKDAAQRTSSTRIQSYLILPLVYMMILFIIFNEGVQLVHAIKTGADYNISTQFIVTLGSLLAHHLALLGINKNSKAEPKYEQLAQIQNTEMPQIGEVSFANNSPINNKKKEEESKADPEEGMI